LNYELDAIQPISDDLGNCEINEADPYEQQTIEQQQHNGLVINNSDCLNFVDNSSLSNPSKSPNQMLHIIREEQNELNICNGNNNAKTNSNPAERDFSDSNEIKLSNLLISS